MKTTTQINNRLTRQMCKASDGVYKKMLEKRYGIKVCRGVLSETEIEDLQENISLIKYLTTTKNHIGETCCDLNKLIEELT